MKTERELDLLRIQRGARGHARRMKCIAGGVADTDDFSQFCLMYAIQKNQTYREMNYRCRFADFMRENFGRTYRNKSKTFGKKMPLNNLPYDENHNKQTDSKIHEKSSMDLDIYFDRLSGYERLIYGLHHRYGFTLFEIGELRGVSESRICQEMKVIQEQITVNVNRSC